MNLNRLELVKHACAISRFSASDPCAACQAAHLGLCFRRPYDGSSLQRALGVSRANVSQYLAILKAAGVISHGTQGTPCVLPCSRSPEVKQACELIRGVLGAQIQERPAIGGLRSTSPAGSNSFHHQRPSVLGKCPSKCTFETGRIHSFLGYTSPTRV